MILKISCFTGGIAQTNGYLIEGGPSAVAVDAPEGMASWLTAQGKPVSHLLLTHQHFDHCQDAAAIQQAGTKVLAFSPFSRDLTLEFLMGFVGGSSFQVEQFTVDELLEGKDQVEVGGLVWKLAHVPGHSADSVTFHYEPEKLLMGGDVLFAGGIGRTDFPGGSFQVLIDGIKRHVLPLPDDTRLLPGHGPETTIGEERRGNVFLAGA
jgi:hydroxyacylglutathione hydrolase